jgi:hypothetical protein
MIKPKARTSKSSAPAALPASRTALSETKTRLFTSVQAAALPLVHVLIKVTRFRDLMIPQEGSWAASEYELKLLTRHPNLSLWRRKGVVDSPCQQLLKVRNEGVILRFTITDAEHGRIYRPVAMTLTRRRARKPVTAVFPSSGTQQGAYSPFSSLEFNGWTLQITDTLPPPDPDNTAKRRFKSYEAGLFLQRLIGGNSGCMVLFFENDDSGGVSNDNEDAPADDHPEISESEGEEE